MPSHAETRLLPYSPEQLFDLVADVEHYPDFLPWCAGARIRDRQADGCFTADLIVGFRMIRESFTSRVTPSRPDRIDIEYVEGPFRRLENRWLFHAKDGGCEIDFHIEFEVRSRILATLLEPLFGEAVQRMVGAFATRAEVVYGAGGAGERDGSD